MLTPEQIKNRINSIGGSEVASVLGMSPFSTALEIWAVKTQQIEPEDISHKWPVRLGHKFEDIVADLFCEETGLKVRRVNETLVHPRYPFLTASIDRKIVGSNEALECKSTAAWNAKNWIGDAIPDAYILQCQHYMGIAGYDRMKLACLIGNQAFQVKTIERDQKLIDDMTAKLVHFWTEFVVPKKMPMTASANDGEVLGRLFPQQTPGSEITFGDEMNALIENRNSLYSDAKSIESHLEKIENDIKLRMGDFETGKTDLNLITWKAQSRKSLDAKRLLAELPDVHAKYLQESSFRVLRIKPVKQEK